MTDLHNNRTRRAMRIAALGCLLACLSLGGCKQKPTENNVDLIRNPRSAQGYDSKEQMPQLTFDNEMHDFGRLSAGENISYSFKFTNTGNADLVITGCDASCGCTVPDYPKGRIAPGKTGYITVSFKSQGMSGQQVKEIDVYSNTQPSSTKLRIMAHVR